MQELFDTQDKIELETKNSEITSTPPELLILGVNETNEIVSTIREIVASDPYVKKTSSKFTL